MCQWHLYGCFGRKHVHCLLFNDLVAVGSKADDAALFQRFNKLTKSASGNQSALADGDGSGSGSERFKLRFKAPLLECLVIDDLAVYGRGGKLKLREDTPMAAAMMQAAAKNGGDMSRLARALELSNGGASAGAQDEASRGWALLKVCTSRI